MANDWSSLPYDVLRKISELVLAKEDLDHYVVFRAVCPQWRSATADPSKAGGFELTIWMMLERERDHRSTLEPKATGVVTFVNLGTGRFLRKSMPRLRSRYFFVGAAAGCGLLVLGEKAPPHRTLVLNPFTGAEIQFRAPIPAEQVNAVAVTMASSSSPSTTRVFISAGLQHGHSVRWADERSRSFREAGYTARWPEPGFLLQHMAASAGAVHATNTYGSIISSTDVVAEEEDEEESERNIITMAAAIPGPSLVEGNNNSSEPDDHRYYLVRSEGELLLMRGEYRRTGPVVCKVDSVNKVLVPLRSLGSRALFVSDLRCLAVDASKFPTVQPGIIYYAGASMVTACDYENVAGGWTELAEDLDTECLECCCRPVTLPQIFASYCRAFDQHSELEKMLLFGGDDGYEWNEWDGNGE